MHTAHSPLIELLREPRKNGGRKVPWTPAAESAKPALLSHQHPKALLALVTYVSDVAIGASLQQKCDGHRKTPGFFTWKLTSRESRYCTYDQILLAIYTAMKFFQHLLQGRDFVIKTDNKTPGLCFHAEAGQG
jgi:hypothetical protein